MKRYRYNDHSRQIVIGFGSFGGWGGPWGWHYPYLWHHGWDWGWGHHGWHYRD